MPRGLWNFLWASLGFFCAHTPRALACWVGLLCVLGTPLLHAQNPATLKVEPMFGAVLLEGYDNAKDPLPTGSVLYDPVKNEFHGLYQGLKAPKGRRALFAWLHDTVNQRVFYMGPVGWLKKGSTLQSPGTFVVPAPKRFKNGRFESYEIFAISAESTQYIEGNRVVTTPKEPAGSDLIFQLKPAYYLFAKLPGADTNLHFCGHGQQMFYAKDLDKQFCYDCLCGQRYRSCYNSGITNHQRR